MQFSYEFTFLFKTAFYSILFTACTTQNKVWVKVSFSVCVTIIESQKITGKKEKK